MVPAQFQARRITALNNGDGCVGSAVQRLRPGTANNGAHKSLLREEYLVFDRLSRSH